LPFANFSSDSRRYGGLAVYCRICCRARKLESNARGRARDPQAFAERMSGYKKRHREVHGDRLRTEGRVRYLRDRYGLTPDELAARVAAQEGKCAICRTSTEKLVVDHNHTTDAIRALLCNGCNLAIGHLRDDPERARAAAAYLDLWSA
jgi:hypothetical protein